MDSLIFLELPFVFVLILNTSMLKSICMKGHLDENIKMKHLWETPIEKPLCKGYSKH